MENETFYLPSQKVKEFAERPEIVVWVNRYSKKGYNQTFNTIQEAIAFKKNTEGASMPIIHVDYLEIELRPEQPEAQPQHTEDTALERIAIAVEKIAGAKK